MKAIILALVSLYASFSGAKESHFDDLFNPCGTHLNLPDPNKTQLKQALEAGQRMNDYFTAVEDSIVERDYIVQGIQRALIGRQPVLLVGPPGNAKTKLISYALGHIIDEQTNEPSFFTDQMTFETTISDTHGPLDFKTLMETGRQDRFLDEGIYGHYFSLLDEQFDMRPNAYRNVLTALSENRYKNHIGKTWMMVGASNKSIPEVYARFNLYDDSARALIDRYAYVFYVGAELLEERNNIKVIQSGHSPLPKLPKLTVQDLMKVNTLLPFVEIPNHVAHLLSYLDYQLKPILEGRESQSLANYLEKVARGEPPSTPPWKSTKYMSPRTLGRAGTILRASVILEWIQSGGKRDLVASIDDLQSLVSFYSLNGPSDEDVSFLLTRTAKDTEKDQLSTVQLERQIFERLFEEAKLRFNQTIETLTPVQELMAKARNHRAMKPAAKAALEQEVRDAFLRAYAARRILETVRRFEVTPELIAQESSLDVLFDILCILNPNPDKLKAKLTEWVVNLDQNPGLPPGPGFQGEVQTVTADQLKANQSINIEGNALFDIAPSLDFRMSSDGNTFFVVDDVAVHTLNAKVAKDPLHLSEESFNETIFDGKIFSVAENFEGFRLEQNEVVNDPGDVDTDHYGDLLFVDEAAHTLVLLAKNLDGESGTQMRVHSDLTVETESISWPIGHDLHRSYREPVFSWQGSDKALYTLPNRYQKLFRYSQNKLEFLSDFSKKLPSQSSQIAGRIGDNIFLKSLNAKGLPTLSAVNPVADTVSSMPVLAKGDTSPFWVSRWGTTDFNSGVKVWLYKQNEGLVLRTIKTGQPAQDKLVVSTEELLKYLDNSVAQSELKVRSIFEDSFGNVLFLTANGQNDYEFETHKIEFKLLRGK